MDRCGLEIDKEKTRLIKGGYDRKYNPKLKQVINTFNADLRILNMVCKPREIEELLFRKLEDLPDAAEPFVGLSNGSYVTCYYVKTPEKTVIYRPNSNAKGVYNPYDTENHIAFSTWRG